MMDSDCEEIHDETLGVHMSDTSDSDTEIGRIGRSHSQETEEKAVPDGTLEGTEAMTKKRPHIPDSIEVQTPVVAPKTTKGHMTTRSMSKRGPPRQPTPDPRTSYRYEEREGESEAANNHQPRRHPPQEDELRRLCADNARLARELEVVRAELKAFKAAFAEARADQAAAGRTSAARAMEADSLKELMEEMRRDLLISLGGMINARFEELESRLPPEPVLRPPLAADKRQEPPPRPWAKPGLNPQKMKNKATGHPPTPPQGGNKAAGTRLDGLKSGPKPQPQPTAGTSRQEVPTAGSSRREGAAPAATKTSGTNPESQRHQTEAPPKTPNQNTTGDGALEDPTEGNATQWTTVARRKGKKGKAPPTQPTPQNKKTQPRPVIIAAPRTAAIVLTLKEGTETDYITVLAKARANIKLADIGLESVKVKTTMTGSRLIEVATEQPESTADLLAEKLRIVIGGWVEISRPTKTADLKITGLDETVSQAEMAAAIAAKGGCAPDQVKVGTIRVSVWGQCSALIRCPAAAAKVVANVGKVAIGWNTATIVPLEPPPMRCYRCMALGHTRALCPSQAEHGAKCFRCGADGHQAATCEAPPKCAVCAEAGRPHAHIMGGAKCAPPSVRGKAPATGVPRTYNQKAGEELEMHVS